MAKRVRILVSALVVAVLLIVGTSVAVMAQEDDTAAAGNGFMARVAQILGIDETTLTDAFAQVCQEIGQECQLRWQEKRQAGECENAENGTCIRQARKTRLSLRAWRGNRSGAVAETE